MLFHLSWKKPNQVKSSQAKPSQTKPNQTKPNQTKPNQTFLQTKPFSNMSSDTN